MNTSFLLCFVIAASSVSAVSIRLKQDPETICLGQENFLRIGAEDSCLLYYQCYAGRAYLMQCPTGTWFNENEQICDSSIPPDGCELDGDLKPEPEPEPETEETEESEESEESSENPLPEDLGLTSDDASDDGSGDLQPLVHINNHYYNGDEVPDIVFEEELFKSIQELFETFLMKLKQENKVEMTNVDSNDFEKTLGDVLRSYRQIKQVEIVTPEEEYNENPIPEPQVEDNTSENDENLGVVKFPNAYQTYKQSVDIKTDGQNLDLEDEDLIKMIISELQNQKASESSRTKRQTEVEDEINTVDKEEDVNSVVGDNEEDQSTEEEEEEEEAGEEDEEQEEAGEEEEDTEVIEEESVDESQEQEPEENGEGENAPEELETEKPNEEGEVEEIPEESEDETKQKHHHNNDHDTNDPSIQEILKDPVLNKESKVKGFFKRLFKINA